MQNIGSDLIRGNIDTIILKTMLDGDKYGLDIIKEVESRSNGTYELKQPTLYSCLKRLENQELISSYWLDSDIGGRRHYYKLTEKGRDFYEKKQEEWAKSKFIIDNLLSNFNYDEYRLVKKDDYDKIIENKQPEYNNNSPLTSSTEYDLEIEDNQPEINENEEIQEPEIVILPNDNSSAELDDEELETEEELGVDLNENLEDSNADDDFETTNLDSDIDDFNNIDEDDNLDENNDVSKSFQETQKSERKYFVNLDDEMAEDSQVASYEEKDYSASESNILSILRRQDDEINTYVGDQHSYINHLNQTDDIGDAEVIQDSLLDFAADNSNTLENKINEFEEAVENLNNFECSYDEVDEVDETDLDENLDEYEEDEISDDVEGIELLDADDDTYIQKSKYVDEVYTEPEEQDHIDFTSSDDDLVYSTAFESVKPETKCACEYVDDFDDLNELNNQTNSSFLMNSDDVDYNNIQIKKRYVQEPYFVQDNSLTDSSDAAFVYSEEKEDVSDFFPTIDTEENIVDDTFNSFDDENTFEEISFAEPENTTYYENVSNNVSNYSFDDIISKNITSNAETITSNYAPNDIFTPSYTSSNYKEKLSNLSTYSKTSTEESKSVETEATKKAKDIASLKEELEQEGIKIKEYKKYGASEQAEKSYLLVNKINLINSLILLFGYVFILSAVYIILNNTGFKDTYGFNFKYFVFGFIPFIAIALYHGIRFIINPYKKVPAKYAPRIMIFISIIITIQLLLITYCVNLQLGFYSFTQSGYNHLIWLVPTLVSFAPILYTTVYMALFYSKNFNV